MYDTAFRIICPREIYCVAALISKQEHVFYYGPARLTEQHTKDSILDDRMGAFSDAIFVAMK